MKHPCKQPIFKKSGDDTVIIVTIGNCPVCLKAGVVGELCDDCVNKDFWSTRLNDEYGAREVHEATEQFGSDDEVYTLEPQYKVAKTRYHRFIHPQVLSQAAEVFPAVAFGMCGHYLGQQPLKEKSFIFDRRYLFDTITTPENRGDFRSRLWKTMESMKEVVETASADYRFLCELQHRDFHYDGTPWVNQKGQRLGNCFLCGEAYHLASPCCGFRGHVVHLTVRVNESTHYIHPEWWQSACKTLPSSPHDKVLMEQVTTDHTLDVKYEVLRDMIPNPKERVSILDEYESLMGNHTYSRDLPPQNLTWLDEWRLLSLLEVDLNLLGKTAPEDIPLDVLPNVTRFL